MTPRSFFLRAVMVAASNGNACTAQVINGYFLLTSAGCIDTMFATGPTTRVTVSMSNRTGNLVTLFDNLAVAATLPNATFAKDIGLILLPTALPTCQDTLNQCASQHPDIPVNAMFQIMLDREPLPVADAYQTLGYGTTDDVNGSGVLRTATIRPYAAWFDAATRTEFLFEFKGSRMRPCEVDWGAPLVVPLDAPRPFYTGLAGYDPKHSCTSPGVPIATYAGLTYGQAQWLLGQLLGVRDYFGLEFDCATADTGLFAMFACDNDGSVF